VSSGAWTVALAALLVNVPFGYWRAGVGKFSVGWFVAVHAAVPLIVLCRWVLGVPFRLATLPVIVAAYFGGQLIGSRIRRSRVGST